MRYKGYSRLICFGCTFVHFGDTFEITEVNMMLITFTWRKIFNWPT